MGEGVQELKITGPSPHFWSAPVPAAFDPDKQTVLAFDYFSPAGLRSLTLKFKRPDGSMAQSDSKPLPFAETWQPFAFDLTAGARPQRHPALRFHFTLKGKTGDSVRIRNLKLRAPTEEERDLAANREARARERQADSEAYLNYLREWYPNEITEVTLGTNDIRIVGQAKERVYLVELGMATASHHAGKRVDAEIPKGPFTLRLPRFPNAASSVDKGAAADRALSRWRLDRADGTPASHCRYGRYGRYRPVAKGAKPLRKLQATHQKGLGGIPVIRDPNHPIFELGIQHATVNVVLDGLISTRPGPRKTPFRFEGHSYYINDRFLRDKISTVKRLNEKDIIVTAILLVGNRSGNPLTHPEAESRGTFAMPNLATEQGARFYRAALHTLAREFAKPEVRISNWVLHNEIDQAGTWTNMGDQPLGRYLESYMRSMRSVFATMRRHDPHARTFISLTHHWTKQSSGQGTYVVRDMLELFAEMARAEGDFEWGVATHPYPRNLRVPDTWNDADLRHDFDTPYITPKNMEVLPAFLAQDRFLLNGKPRAILFSEQGFNSPTLSVEDQRRQAAGLIYAFRKLPKMPTVEAFHLHRYQDMPDREGGLRLGIMDETGRKKLGWDVYKSIGTSAEADHEKLAAAYFDETATELKTVAKPSRPNIVFMVADDLGWSDTTPYLEPVEDFYETPNIAKLAKRGMRFVNAYAASPLCSPTRASILTGQYPGRIRLTTPACHLPTVVMNPSVGTTAKSTKPAVEPQTRTRFPNVYETIPERLRLRGYRSAFVGKWHLGRAPYFPEQQGFDYVVGGREHPGPPGGFFAPWPIDTIPKAPPGSHIDDVITTESVRWLEARAKAEEPFFLNLWFYSVHAPFQAKPALIEKYAEKAKGLPLGAPRDNPVMAAMVETLDDNVGRIMTTLDELGLSENTLVVFTSDNGGNEYNVAANKLATNNHPLRNGKGNINEGGQRVPFIAAWPGQIDAGSENAGLVSSIDLFPTALAAAGAPAAPGQVVDGVNLLPVFKGSQAIEQTRALFCHFPHGPPATGTIAGTSVRRGDWKLTRFYADGPDQADRLRLIDLEVDPGESEDVSANHSNLVMELNQLIADHLSETASLVPVPNPDYVATAHGWTGNKDAVLRRVDDALLVNISGRDPNLRTTDFGKATGQLTVEIHMTQDVRSPVAVYWASRAQPAFGKERSALVPQTSRDSGVWRTTFEVGEDRMTALRIDPAQAGEQVRIDSIRLLQWTRPGEAKTVRLWDF